MPAPALFLISRHLLPLPTAKLATGGSQPPPQRDENQSETGAGHGMIHERVSGTTAFGAGRDVQFSRGASARQ